MLSLTLLLILALWASYASSRPTPETSISAKFEQWIDTYGRMYKDGTEKERHFEIFKKNIEQIKTHNDDISKKYKLGVNAFTDLTVEEFKAVRNGFKAGTQRSKVTSFKYENASTIPTTMDWRKKGAVTPIKDQQQCGK